MAGIIRRVTSLTDALLSVVYPCVCEICGETLVEGEELLCSRCLVEVPRTFFHLSDFNHLHQRLLGRAHADKASSFFHYFKSDAYAEMIHKLKYGSRREIGVKIGRIYAREILHDSPDYFCGVDLFLPVPVHFFKLLKRGYNQSGLIAKGLSVVTGIPVGDHLVATRGHATQTRKSAFDRWINSAGIFKVRHSSDLDNTHVMLVDDVITTGSTMLCCMEAIHDSAPSAKISVISLASTKAVN